MTYMTLGNIPVVVDPACPENIIEVRRDGKVVFRLELAEDSAALVVRSIQVIAVEQNNKKEPEEIPEISYQLPSDDLRGPMEEDLFAYEEDDPIG